MRDSDVKDWLESQPIARIPDFLRQQQRAYLHPYGFVVRRLDLDEIQPWSIRLHYWPSPRECYDTLRANGVETQLIHAHGWELWSRVLEGLLEERTYQVGNDEAGRYGVYRTPGNSLGATSSLSRHGQRVNLVSKSYRVRGADGEAYRIDAGKHHSTLPASRSVSLVATLQYPGQHSDVLVRGGTAARISNPSPMTDPEESRRSVEDAHDDWASSFVLFTSGTEILLVRTRNRPGQWQPIGGERDPADVSPMATLLREVREETQLDLDPTDLHLLGSRPADVGMGRVYFWSSPLPDGVNWQFDEEILDGARWGLSMAASVPMFEGTRWAVHQLMLQQREPDS